MASDRLARDVKRLLALIDHHDIVGRFKRDWNVLDRSAEAFESQVARVRESANSPEEPAAP